MLADVYVRPDALLSNTHLVSVSLVRMRRVEVAEYLAAMPAGYALGSRMRQVRDD